MIVLKDVYMKESPFVSPEAAAFLYELLDKRDPDVSISHKKTPSYEEHLMFVLSRPYESWMIIEKDGRMVGSVYVTRNGEIGLAVSKESRRRGYGEAALDAVIAARPGKTLYANVNPKNAASAAFFAKKGFVHIQNVLRREPS